MAIGIWLLIIGLLIIIAGVVIFYVTSILSAMWLWVIIGLGVLLIIVGAILFFMQRKKPAPPKKEVPPPQPLFIPPEPEPPQMQMPQMPMYPPYMSQPQNPLIIPSGGQGNGNTDLAILLQQQNFQQQQQIRDLENKFEKQQERERDERRYKNLEAKIMAQQALQQQPMPNIIVPPKGQLVPAQVQRGYNARQELQQAFVNPQVISSGIQAGVAGMQVAPAFLQAAAPILTNQDVIKLGNSAIKGIGGGLKVVGSSAGKLITR